MAGGGCTVLLLCSLYLITLVFINFVFSMNLFRLVLFCGEAVATPKVNQCGSFLSAKMFGGSAHPLGNTHWIT
jgi:hypothetical protein